MPEDATPRRLSRREFVKLAAAAGFVTGPGARWLRAAVEKATVRGVVYGDGAPLGGVRVSDGRRVVTTDAKGRYAIDVGPDSGRFLFVTTPRGYWTDLFHVPAAEAARSKTADFHLEARAQPERFRFVFWTDMHLEGGGLRLQKFRSTVAETNSLRPAFVWAQGDICLEGHAGEDYVQCLSGLDAPIRNGAGNHEMLVKEANPRRAFETLFGPTYYSFDWAGAHCVVLDGNRVVSQKSHWSSVHGFLSEREVAWLEADLAAKPPGMPVIAGIHIPLVTTYSARRGEKPGGFPPWIVGNSERVRAILKAHDTRLVLQGHLHENERIVVDGVEYVASQAVSGSWWKSGKGFERGVDHAPRGYRIVEFDGKEIRHRFHSSAESHVDRAGDFGKPLGNVPSSGGRTFVFNGYDVPNSASCRGRIDGGAWKDMPAYPAVNPSLHLIMPHHFAADVDTAKVSPGRHAIEVEASLRGEVFRYREEFRVVKPDPRPVPVVYCSDLHHPHVDPDDHFDLAALCSMPDIDLRGIVLDDGLRQKKQPGRVPVRQMMAITRKNVPVATGLAPRLESIRDTGRSQPKEFQGGVELILRVLRESASPVSIVAVGSMRDVAAAFNRAPDLCAEKVGSLLLFVGDAYSADDFKFREYNVTLDVNAYRAILTSGLPVRWVPCFDGGTRRHGRHASYWRASHRDLLARVGDPVKQYFIYAILRKNEPDPVAFLRKPVDPGEWKSVLAMQRNLWCCAVFTSLPGRTLRVGDRRVEPFTFERVLVNVDATGMALYPPEIPHYSVERFRVADPASYPDVMTSVTAEMLAAL